MKNNYVLLIIFLFLSCNHTRNTSSFNKEVFDIIIENVNIIDVENNRLIKNKDVVISGKKIADILPHGKSKVVGATIINGEGKFLVPGFWDMHVHTLQEGWYTWQFPLFVANGIIGFREMWGRDIKLADSIRLEMQKGLLHFFHFASSGHIIDGKKAFWPGSLSVSQEDNAVKVVDSLKTAGSDFIKVYSDLEPDIFKTIAKRCREMKITFAGHVPNKVWLTEASKAGMASMEHLFGFLIEACSYPDSAMGIRKKMVENFQSGVTSVASQQYSIDGEAFMLNNFSETRMRNIAKTLKKNKTYIVPTLVTLRGDYFSNDSSFTNDERLKYMSNETKEYWKEVTANKVKRNSNLVWQNKRMRYEIEKKIIKILWEEKVAILSGTDSDNPYAFPGFSLHDEIALFVDCGMSPIDALRTATLNPVKYLKMTDSLGTVEKGKRADMVLLNSNPLIDIKNTKNINSVITDGKIFTSGDLDKLKNQVLKMNAEKK